MLCNLESAMSENVSDNEMKFQIENVPRRVAYSCTGYSCMYRTQLTSSRPNSDASVRAVRLQLCECVHGTVQAIQLSTVGYSERYRLPSGRVCVRRTAVHDACRSVPMTPLARASARGPVASPVRRGRAVPVAGGGAPCGLWPVRRARAAAAARYFLQSLWYRAA